MVTKLRFTALAILMFCVTLNGWGQTSYLGLDGGFEGSATIDNTNTYSAPQAGKWSKANATQTLTNETSTVRSGANSLKVNNSSTTGRRVWSPNITVSSTTSQVTVQYYIRVANTTNSQDAQPGIINNTEGLSGAYATGSAANTWTKVTYNKASSTWTTISGLFLHRQLGTTGGDMFVDDMCVYTGAVDNTAPNSAGTVTVNNPSATSLDISWTAASGGVDGGGYMVVRYATNPNADNDPLVNGIYAAGNTYTLGTGSLTGTVRYVGTGTSFTDNVGLSSGTTYYYKVYTFDKAYNYAAESSASGTTSSTYTVTYNGNGNTGGTAPTDASSPYVSGSTVTVLGNTGSLLNSGFNFSGWNTAANGSGTSYAAGATFTINANTTLYAVWTVASGPSITTTAASFGGPFCNSGTNNISVAYTTTGTLTGTYKVQISDATGAFTASTTANIIGTGTGTSPISATIPSGLSAGTGYKVRVINDNPATYGTDNGTAFTITAATTPTVSINDPGAAICGNQSYTFTPTPAGLGGGTASYQWTLNGSAGAASGSTYSSSSWSTGNTVQAVLTVTGGCVTSTTASSNTVTITATTPVTPSVTIASNAASNTACAGTSVTFTPTPTNGGTPTYQWQVNSGTTTSGATFSSSALANGDVVKCTMTSTVSCVTASTASATPITMTINALPSSASGISNQTVCGNGNVVFSVNDPGAGSTIEWSTNGTSNNDGTGAGGSGAVTKTKAVTVGTPITEYARISNSNGCKSATWVSATGTAVAAPSISVNPADQTVNALSAATFSVTATGAASYSWYESTDGGSTWGASPIATGGVYSVSTNTLTVTPNNTGMNGYKYRVVVNGNSPCTTVTSTAATLTVNPGPIWTNPITGTNPGQTTPYTTGDSYDGNITVSGISRSGVSGNNANDRYNTTNWPTAASIDLNKYIEFKLTPVSGYAINFTSFVYTAQVSGGTPSIALRSSVDGYGSNIGTASVTGTTIALSAAAYQSIASEITFRLYVWNMSATTTTFSVNDFSFNGTVVVSSAPTVAISNTGTPATGGIVYNTTNNPVFGFTLTPSAAVNFTAVNVATAGTATTSDVSNFRLVRDADNSGTYNAGDVLITGTGIALANPLAFSGFTESISTATRYLVIADVAVAAIDGRTLTGSISAATNVTTNGTESGTAAGNTQTIQAPEISVEGNSTVIPDGDVAPSLTDYTSFGNVTVGNSLIRQYTIKNLGAQALNLTGTPRVSITGSSDFTVTAQPSAASIAASGSLTFDVTYTPSGYTTPTATISIANNDGNENPYDFVISGTGVTSQASDIIANAAYTYNTDIPYINYQNPSITNTTTNNANAALNSIDIFKFDVRDGGAGPDVDNLPTILNAVTFNVTNTSAIRAAALFNGNTLVGTGTVNSGSNTISFSGMSGANVTAADVASGVSSISLTLRVSFNTTITDQTQLQVTIASANTTAAGSNTSSGFASFTSVVSSTSPASRNRLQVVADRLAFTTQPQNGSINVALSQFTVSAVDANSNVDINAANSFTLTTSSGSNYTSGSPYTLSAGVKNITDVQYSAAKTSETLTATTTGLTTNTVTSSAFNILAVTYTTGDYRTNPSLSGTATVYFSSTTAISGVRPWQKYNGSTWVDVTGSSATESPEALSVKPTNIYLISGSYVDAAAGGTYNNIQVNFPTTTGYFYTGNTSTGLTISAGSTLDVVKGIADISGVFSLSANAKLIVRPSGDLELNSTSTNFSRNASSTFEVEDLGYVAINSYLANVWNGTEIFHPQSFIEVTAWDVTNDPPLFNNSVTATTVSAYVDGSYSAYFGNLYFTFNTTLTNNWTGALPTGTYNLTHNDFWVTNNNTSNNITLSSGTCNITVGYDLTVDGAGNTQFQATAGSSTLTVNHNFIKNDAGDFRVMTYGAPSATTINFVVNGDMAVNAGFFVTNTTSSSNVNTSVTLKGNLYKAAAAYITNSNTNGYTSETFNFAGSGTTQTVDVVPHTSNDMLRFRFQVKNGAYVQIKNQDWAIATNSLVNVNSGGTLDFGFNGTTPLNLALVSGASSTSFTVSAGGTIKITSADASGAIRAGNATVANGNVRLDSRTYDAAAIYHYIGKANQITGDGLPATLTTGKVIVELTTNALTLTPSASVTINNASGLLEIRKGTVIENNGGPFFTGVGSLTMSDGLYQIASVSSSVNYPRLTGTYTLTGGVVELNGTTNSSTNLQTLTGGKTYYNVKISGASSAGGYKTISSAVVINNNLQVTGTSIFDIQSKSMTGAAGLTMDAGLLRMSMVTNTTLPEITGTATPYAITGGTVEFYEQSASATNHLIRGTYGSGTNVTYNNIEINAAAANETIGNTGASASFNVTGILNVNSPSILALNKTDIVGGTGKVNVLAGAGLFYGSSNGIVSGTALSGNIQVTGASGRNFAQGTYGFLSPGDMVTGNALPATVNKLIVLKNAATEKVTLTNNVTVATAVSFTKGIITTGANKVTLNAAATVSGASATTGWVNGNLEKYLAAATATKDFEIGDAAVYAPVNLTFAGNNNGTGSLTAATTGTDHPQVSSSGVNSASSVNRYWSLTNNNVTGFGTYSATFNFVTADIDAAAVSQTANFIVAKYNSSTWAQPTLGTRTSTSTQITGGTDFGDYQIGVIISGYVWTGAANTHNWGTAGNWQAGSIPPSASTSDITIQTTNASNYPTLPSSYVLGKVTMNDNATLDLGGYTLDVKGNWFAGTSAGSTVSGAGALVLSGTAQQTINGKTTFSTLRLNNSNGATTSGATINVTTALELQAGAFNATGATVTLKSTATTHAIFNDFGAPVGTYTGTYTGSINAERYYRATSANSYNQHYMGSPVANATLAQFGAGGSSGAVTPTPDCSETQLASTSVYGSVFSYSEAGGASCPMASWTVKANSAAATPAQGYSVAKTGAGVLTVSGTPNTATSYAVAGLTNSNWTKGTLQHPSTTAFGSGWHMVSNPYNATLDLTSITPPAGFDNQIQVWDVIQGQYYPLTGTKLIAPFQAFFVHKTSPGGSATYTIDGNWRTATPATFYAQSIPEQLTITATNNSNQLYDVATVGFNSDATDQFDPQFDANKLTGSIGRHNLSTQNNGYELNTNILHSITETSTVNLTFEPGSAGNYTLTFDGLNSFDPTSYIMLEDKQLNTMHDVRSGDYTFSATAQDNWNRFVLHFTPKAEIATTDQQCETLGTINVTQPGTANWNYTITDNQSNTIASGTLNETTPIAVNTPTGTYTLTLTDNNNYQVVKTVTVNGTTPIVAAFSPSTTTTTTNTDVAFNSTTTATDYYWDFGDGTTATGQNAIHSYGDTGTYTVSLIVISANGCSNTTTQTVTVNAEVQTGIGNLNNNQNITIWSNGNTVYVDFSRITRTDATIEIYNVLGQQLVSDKFGRNQIYNTTLDKLEAGYVIVKVRNNNTITTKRLVLKQ